MLGRAHRFHGYAVLRRTYGRSQAVRGPLISLRFSARAGGK